MTCNIRSFLATVIIGVLASNTVNAASRTDLVLGMSIEPSGLDPTTAAPVAIGQVVWQNLFEGLVTINKDGDIEPELADSWVISEDGLTYTFDLQDNVKFQNGIEFSAKTAKYTLDRLLSADSINPQKSLYKTITKVTAPDSDTLVVELSTPSSDLLYWLGFPAAVMVEPSSEASNSTNPIGTGPFRFAEWKRGNQVTLVKNTDYWGDAAKLDKVTFRFIGDPQAQAAALNSGGIDAMPEFSAPELVSQFKNNSAFETVIGTTSMEVIAGMNNSKKPFNDIRVRQALMLATDRQAIIDATSEGLGKPLGSHYSPSDAGYQDLTNVYSYDPVKAKQLLSEAGYPNGFSFTMKVPTRPYTERAAEIMQAYFSMVGVTMNIESSEFPAKWVQDVFKDTNYDMTIIGHAEPLDIGIYARNPYYFNYSNPDFDKVMADIANSTTEEDRIAGYQQAQKILANDVPSLFLYAFPKIGIWKKDLVGLWTNEPVPSNDLTDVYWSN
ncbi:ABC transporter substrate-binding protein [Vibrio sp. TH_r3]|uniref:ABC transporter substrate-binding protein n=1 Tax=unclassified Vibrio TaxID=2614977 RepID=UPI0029552288|nr:ABC transporter substrate-binding protein [Vibrio sp. TH_r3]MDV7103633.1 ABC transporter substrate-binding protein [Vibrio sp. TH_r3]